MDFRKVRGKVAAVHFLHGKIDYVVLRQTIAPNGGKSFQAYLVEITDKANRQHFDSYRHAGMYFTEIDEGKAFAVKCAEGKFDWRKKIVLYEAKIKQEQQILAQRYDNAATKFVDDLENDGIEISAFLKYRERFDNFNAEVIAKIYRAADIKDKK